MQSPKNAGEVLKEKLLNAIEWISQGMPVISADGNEVKVDITEEDAKLLQEQITELRKQEPPALSFLCQLLLQDLKVGLSDDTNEAATEADRVFKNVLKGMAKHPKVGESYMPLLGRAESVWTTASPEQLHKAYRYMECFNDLSKLVMQTLRSMLPLWLGGAQTNPQ